MTLNFERFSETKTRIWSYLKITASKSKLHRMSSFILLSMILPVIVSPNLSQTGADKVEAKSNNVIKLSVESPRVLITGNTISEIKPGESATDKQAREKAEADAKAASEAKAAADAKAKQAAASRTVVARENRSYSDPSDFSDIYQRASWSVGGLDPRLLRAVHLAETGGSGSTMVTSYAGAQGPMQFLPSTWKRYGVDGNGDGVADIGNVEDAIFAAAKYLKACGYPDFHKALWGYNPSTSYYNKVMRIYNSL